MNILHAVENYYPSKGGAQEVVRQLSERMVALGHEVTVATSKRNDRSTAVINGVKIAEFNIKGNSVMGYEGNIQAYKEFLVNNKFDVVMIYAAQQWAADLFFEVMDQIMGGKVFVPCGFSGLHNPVYASYFKHMPRILKQFDKTIYLSNYYQDISFARKNNVNNCVVIPNGADEREFVTKNHINIRSRLGIQTNHSLILCVGMHSGLKGHDEAMQIFKKSSINHATLLVVGGKNSDSGCMQHCKQVERLSFLDPRLIIKDKRIRVVELSRQETIAAYFDADVFLFPSNIECSPLVLFESAAVGLPFLSTDVGNAREITAWVKGGYILPTYKKKYKSYPYIEPSAKLLTQTLMNKEKQNYGEIMRKECFSKYTWDIIARRYLELYKSLVKQ